MAGKSVTHSESWWATQAPPHVLRCNGTYKSTGEQCRRVAEDGSIVCDQHGGAAGQVRRRAAERILFTADEAASKLVAWMNDPSVDTRERIKVAQDLLDRNGIVAAQVHKIMPVTEDPIEALFRTILDDPNALTDAEITEPLPAPTVEATDDYEDLIGRTPAQDEKPARRAEQPARSPRLPQAADQPSKDRSSTTPPKHIREGLARLP
ncbi:hypothetical protein [Aeromicrobium endophyticum]|uniref:Uncharacterized protein n=1 Tax=Aeromicrobium endophyticum TaxID=2292704 RepID=A0A371P9I7_9ACTN|nr:hypothetical protein [Aeromicrobium endophyticum]REK72140.1 hypothetical protein DX116_00350 [Aeromicrobium endophyticum]